MSDEPEDKPSALHPSLAAVLERDGISLPRLADLLGLDRRTLREYGRQDEKAEARRAAYRTLDDLMAGRAHAVAMSGGDSAPTIEPIGWRRHLSASPLTQTGRVSASVAWNRVAVIGSVQPATVRTSGKS